MIVITLKLHATLGMTYLCACNTMKQPSILLTTLNAKYIHLNLAIRLLFELNKADERLAWKEFTIKEDTEAIAAHCSQFEVVCFSCYIWNITQTLAVAESIKAIAPNTKIMLGGPEVTYDWESIIFYPYIDYIITGEGEIPFANFLEQYPNVAKVPNLVSKNGREVVYQKQNDTFALERYEHTQPYHNDDPSTLRNRVLYIETSRGCPYKCEFCLASLDNRVRYLPIAHIKENLRYLMQQGRVIKFLDRTFNVKKDFTLDIFQFILDHAQPENVFQFEITADILHPAIMDFIIEKVPKGMFRFEIGIQTVNQKANLEVGRKQNFEKTKEVILKLKDHVDMHLDLIVGLPLDYKEDIKYSFEEVFKLFPPELQLGFLKFLKGTPVREKHEQYGYIFDEKAPYQIIKSNFLSEEELAEITRLEHALEIYWNKPRLKHTLTYITHRYSIFDFLEGLGTYFEKEKGFLHYTAFDMYRLAHEFIVAHYPEDALLIELLAIDYYLQPSIRPTPAFISEPEKKEKFALLDQWKLSHQQNRYIVIPVQFDVIHMMQTGSIIEGRYYFIVEYNGKTAPRMLQESRIANTLT